MPPRHWQRHCVYCRRDGALRPSSACRWDLSALRKPNSTCWSSLMCRTLPVLAAKGEPRGETASAGVIKDAGDDPDVTRGAEIFAFVCRIPEAGIHIKGGVGVGVVPQRGLELPVGSRAINPVPQQMIRQAVTEVVG